MSAQGSTPSIVRSATKPAERSNARQAASRVLLQIQKDDCYADQLIDRELTHGSLAGPDRGLFAELVLGVLRRQGTLDHILTGLLTQPLARQEQQVLIWLRLGLYQLIYLDRVPESAAVNETVNLAKQSLPRASGLVNAVLRNYLRNKESITFPDIKCAPAAAIAARHSHPEWLVKLWFSQLGEDETALLAEASSQPPQLTLRANTLRISRDELLQRFTAANINATPCRYAPDGVLLHERHQIPSLPGFDEGLFVVQDEASQLACLLLDPQPGELILDSCAAPGGKATYLAQLMGNRGEIVANDLAAGKLRLIEETAVRLGITSITTRSADLLKRDSFPPASYDRILLDAPCSGLGVIRRHPEAKWRLTPADLTRLAATQKRLLEQASRALKPGGTLLYSTCSTSAEENERVIDDFLSRHTDFVLEDPRELVPQCGEFFSAQGVFRAWPHRHAMDGFFAARLKKRDRSTL